MDEIVKFLEENPIGSLATVENGQPFLRPWGFGTAKNNKLWFCTANIKEVFKQLKNNSCIAFSATSSSMVTVRIRGEISFSDDLSIKKQILENSKMAKAIYKMPDNPIFEVFYIEEGEAVLSDFSGNPPKIVKL